MSGLVVRRAALDIGSGATKLVIADVLVESSQSRVQLVRYQSERPVAFSTDLLRAETGCLSEEVMLKGLHTLADLLDVCRRLKVTQFAGVATEVFRQAENGGVFLARVKDLGLSVQTISQEQEAMLGYLSGLGMRDWGEDSVVVWDSGGGSFQISSRVSAGEPLSFYMGSIGALSSHKFLVEEVCGGRLTSTKTVNPVGAEDCDRLLALLEKKLDQAPGWLLRRDVVAIGGSNSIFQLALRVLHHMRNSESESLLTEATATEALVYCLRKTDAELDFARDFENADPVTLLVPKLCLLVAVMRKAAMRSILPVHCVGSCIGILTSEQYWPSGSR